MTNEEDGKKFIEILKNKMGYSRKCNSCLGCKYVSERTKSQQYTYTCNYVECFPFQVTHTSICDKFRSKENV